MKNIILGILVFCLYFNYYMIPQAMAQAKKASRKSAVTKSNSSTAQANPDKESWYTRECNRLFEEYKFNETWELLKQAEEDFPGSALIANWQGVTLVQLKRYDEAIPYLKKTLRGPANLHDSAERALGRAYLGKNEYDEAIKHFKLAVRSSGTAYDYFLLADAYDQAGKPDEAIENFTAAIGNHKSDFFLNYSFKEFGRPILYERRGYVYFRQNMPDRAKEDWKTVIELYPRYATVFGEEKNMPLYFDFEKRKQTANEALDAAKDAQATGNYAQAFQLLEKAYAWMPVRDPVTMATLGRDIPEEFINVYPRLAVKPALPEAGRRIFVQANAHTRNKNYDAALESYNLLLSVVPWYPEAQYNRALIEGEKKWYSYAIKDMKKYLALAPDAPDSRAAQDKVYEWEAFVVK